MQMNNQGLNFYKRVSILTLSAILACVNTSRGAYDVSEIPPEWHFSAGLGLHFFEGDQETQHGFAGLLQAAHDLDKHWSLEGTFSLLPALSANRIWSASNQAYRPGLHERTSDTWAMGLALDGRYHFTRQYRFDPYLTLGVGALFYGDRRDDGGNSDLALRAGAGMFYHLSDTLALRLDLRGMRVLNIAQANAMVSVGVAWTPGGRPHSAFQVMGGVRDSDGDGLSDWEEIHIYFTDHLHPDSDGDGLSDHDELLRYGTDPHNPDTDGDGLTDYQEVMVYGTDPLKRDTDGGGVDDWHEIMVDGTDPLDPSDDLQLHTLYLRFDYDQAIVRPEFYASLDVIGLTLQRDPKATVRIEGHADRLQRSNPVHNQQLSERRALAVKQYLVESAGIEAGRLQAVGYGFQRPREPNDPVNGNPANRRVEVYIRSGEHIDRYGVQEGQSPLPETPPVAEPVRRNVPANPAPGSQRPADTK